MRYDRRRLKQTKQIQQMIQDKTAQRHIKIDTLTLRLWLERVHISPGKMRDEMCFGPWKSQIMKPAKSYNVIFSGEEILESNVWFVRATDLRSEIANWKITLTTNSHHYYHCFYRHYHLKYNGSSQQQQQQQQNYSSIDTIL